MRGLGFGVCFMLKRLRSRGGVEFRGGSVACGSSWSSGYLVQRYVDSGSVCRIRPPPFAETRGTAYLLNLMLTPILNLILKP